MSLGVFSIDAHADSSTYLKINYFLYEKSLGIGEQINIHNGQNGIVWIESHTISNKKKFDFFHEIIITDSSNKILAPGGRPASVKLNNLYWSIDFSAHDNFSNSIKFQPNDSEILPWGYCQLVYLDGSTEDVPASIEYITNPRTNTANFHMTFTPKKDVQRIWFYYQTKFDLYQYSQFNSVNSIDYSFALGVKDDNNLNLDVSIQSEEAGLLEGIIGKLTSIWDSIKNLPQNIWNLIENGLKNLFVPSENDLIVYKDKWDQLLSERLGAVYQVVHILTESWDGIMDADQTNTIEFPEATIDFSGVPFTFGGYTVQIVPQGFETLVEAVKVIVGVVCTIACINGLRKRYEEVVGVEK